jgi:hypothetical protein
MQVGIELDEPRSRGDEPLVKELLEPSNKWDIYAINPADEIELQKWKLASHEKGGGKWGDDRLLAFSSTQLSRVLCTCINVILMKQSLKIGYRLSSLCLNNTYCDVSCCSVLF